MADFDQVAQVRDELHEELKGKAWYHSTAAAQLSTGELGVRVHVHQMTKGVKVPSKRSGVAIEVVDESEKARVDEIAPHLPVEPYEGGDVHPENNHDSPGFHRTTTVLGRSGRPLKRR